MEIKKFFDADFRKDPKTKLFCAYCQRDLNINKLSFMAYLDFEKEPTIYNPNYKGMFDDKVLICPIGSECAKKIGKEWLVELKFVSGSDSDE